MGDVNKQREDLTFLSRDKTNPRFPDEFGESPN